MMSDIDVNKIRNAAEAMSKLIKGGMSWPDAEMQICKEYDLDEAEQERMTECYCTEFAEDDG